MDARHFKTDGTDQPSRGGQGHTPTYGQPAAGGDAFPNEGDYGQYNDDTFGGIGQDNGLGQSMGFEPLPIGRIPADPQASSQQGMGYGYPNQPRVYGANTPKDVKPRRRIGPVIAVIVILVVVCLVGVGAWSLLSDSSLSGANSNSNASAQQATNTTEGQAASANQNQATSSTSQATTASDVMSTLSTLQHNGEDCSLPTDGAEVDVLGGRVLVAFQSSESAQELVSHMASASVALADALSQSQLADSSTASDGVSQVPAASTPGAIASSENGTTFASVEVVAMAEGGYVVSAITMTPTSASGLSDAGEAAIFEGADSYAVQGTAYTYSGLRSLGVEQSKGDAPALLTGEAITISMGVSQTTSSSSNTGTTSTSSRSSNSTGSSTSSSTSTSSTSSGSTSSRRSSSGSSYGSGSSSAGTGYSYGTGYSTGGSSSYDYSYDSGSSDYSGSTDSTSTDSGSGTSSDTSSTSTSQDDGSEL